MKFPSTKATLVDLKLFNVSNNSFKIIFLINMIIAALRGLLNVICKHNISIHGTLCDFVQMVITISKMKTKQHFKS